MSGRKEYEVAFKVGASLGSSYNTTFSKAQQELSKTQKEIQQLYKIQADIQSFQKQEKAIENTRAKLALYQTRHDNIQKEIDQTGNKSSALANKLATEEYHLSQTSAKLKEQESKLEEVSKALEKAGVNTGNLVGESDRLAGKMDDLKEKQVNYGNSASQAFSVVGQAITTAGVAKLLKEVAEAYAECIEASMEYESAVTGVFKTVDGTEAELQAISSGIKNMATEIPATTTEIAGVAEAAGQLGIATEDVLDFTRVMIDLGESTNLSADDAATSLAKFANITGTAADNYSRLGSVVVDLGNNFATTEADIVAMSTRLASAGTLAGFSEADIMALSAAMSSVGIEAEAGGTAMTQTLSAIEEAVATKSKMLSKFAKVAGMSAKEFSNKWKTSPIEALQSFITGLGKLDEKGESAVLVLDELGLSGVRQSNMLKSLGLAAETLGGAVKTANTAWEQNTALTIEAEKRYATTQSKLDMMQNAYNNVKISIGDGLTPELQGLYDITTDVLKGTSEFIEDNPALVKSVTAFTGVVGLATAGLTGYATVAKVVKALNLAKLFSAGAPVMLGIGAVAALAAGVVGVVDAYNDAEEAARKYGDEVTAAAEEYKQAMSSSDELEKHTNEWKELNDIISSGTAPVDEVNKAKERLKENEQWLIDNYGIYMDSDGKVSEEEIESLEERNAELRETARLKAQIALYDAKERYDESKDKVQDTQAEHDALVDENKQLATEQAIISKHSAMWVKTRNSEEYKNADFAKQDEMYADAQDALHEELRAEGINSDYYADSLGSLGSWDGLQEKIKTNQRKINEYERELLEYKESATEYKSSARAIIEMDIADIPTDNIQAFADVAENIGAQGIAAELSASEMERYANQLTEAAHAANLLPEEQRIVFNADGTVDILQQVEEGVSELDGKSVEITADANADAATVKINDITYKVLKYDNATGVATLSADGKKAMGEIDVVTGELKVFSDTEAEAYLDANTDNFEKNIKNAKDELTALDGKKITVTAVFKAISDTIKSALGFDGYATGTMNATPGWHLVGENGPEIVEFSGGERVYNNAETNQLFSHMRRANAIMHAQPVDAVMGSSISSYQITIAPQFNVEGGAADSLGDKIHEYADIIVDKVLDTLEEIGIDAKRGAYA